MKYSSILLLSLSLLSGVASAGGTTEAGIGGALGGVLGSVVGPEAAARRKEILANFIPCCIVQSATQENRDFPLLRDKIPNPDTKIYVCQNYACRRPVATVVEMLEQIRPPKAAPKGVIFAEMQ